MTTRRTFKTLGEALAHMAGKGRVVHLLVLHDDDCLHGSSHPCTCTPEFAVEEATVENVLRGAERQRSWLTRHQRN